MNNINTFGYNNGNKYLVKIELAILKAMPSFNIVGLGSKTIQESRERILSVIDHLSLKKPIGKIVVNLSPANTNKIGSHYDLPICILFILNCNYGKIKINLNDYIIIGELSLNGQILMTEKSFLAALLAYEHNKKIICSKYDVSKISLIINIENIYAFDTIENVLLFLKNYQYTPIFNIEHKPNVLIQSEINTYCNDLELLYLYILAAGKHNGLIIGSPGIGKTTMVNLLHKMLPSLFKNEILEVLEIYDYASIERDDIYKPPLRSPHFTASQISLIGGGYNQSPGEICLSHKGILFLDEICEFDTHFLNSLRTPLEENQVHISRANYKISYNSNIMLLAASNPCACGYIMETNCKCKPNYLNKIPGPILNRIDATLYMYRRDIDNKTKIINLNDIHNNLLNIYKMQLKRQNDYNAKVNFDILLQYGNFEQIVLDTAMNICNNKKISMRTYTKLLRLTRTIADISASEIASIHHLYIALSFISK